MTIRRNIVWIASYPKSGNTWFRMFMSNLLSGLEDPTSINELGDFPIASSRSLFDKYSGINSSNLTREEINAIRPLVYHRISMENTDTHYFKVHDAWIKNSKGQPIFPKEITKGVIYIIRNPLDIAVSFAFHNNSSIDSTIQIMQDSTYALCKNQNKLYNQLHQELKSWSSHVSSWNEDFGFPVHIVKYEDLMDSPEKTFSMALEYLQLSYSLSAIETAVRNCTFEELNKQENEEGFKEKSINSKDFFRKGIKEDWRNHLTTSQSESIINNHKRIMIKYGYQNI